MMKNGKLSLLIKYTSQDSLEQSIHGYSNSLFHLFNILYTRHFLRILPSQMSSEIVKLHTGKPHVFLHISYIK